MHLSTMLPVSLSLASSVLAQSGLSAASATAVAVSAPSAVPLYSNSTSSGSSAASNVTFQNPAVEKVWVVKVGAANGTFNFAPNTVMAQPGDWVQFQFEPRNHSVVTASFDQPCVPNVNANTDPKTRNVFFSGYMPTSQEGLLTYTVPVVDQSPVWFYCSQQKHCQTGMVGVINPPSSGPQTIQAFIAAAAQAPENLSPDFSIAANNGTNAAQSSSASSATSGSNSNRTATGTTAQATRANDAAGVSASMGSLAVAFVFALLLL